MTAARAAGWLTLALMAAPPARATPPPPPQTHARYGPVVQCLNGYAVEVAADETVLVWDGSFTLVTPAYLINLALDVGDPYREQTRAGEFQDPRLGRIIRYQRTADGRNAEFRLPSTRDEGSVIVRGAEEHLARIARASPGRRECEDFIAPNFPGEDPDAHWWAPALVPAPLFRCEGRVGYALGNGEGQRLPWPLWADRFPARAVLPDAHISVSGPYRVPAGPARGPTDAGYQVSVREDYIGRHLLLSPPRALVRRQRPRGVSDDYDIRIYFSPAGEAAARVFASRLEFVAPDDPRCGAAAPG